MVPIGFMSFFRYLQGGPERFSNQFGIIINLMPCRRPLQFWTLDFYLSNTVHLDFNAFILGIRQVMADKVKRDQIVALKTADVSNNDTVKQHKVCRKTV